jgi:CheY-like chemotaxis protein
MHPVTADGSTAALAALEKPVTGKPVFDLILLDAHMPAMDGFEVAKRIKQNRRLREIKVIMLTSAGEPDDVAQCQALGISAYLTKPVKQSELFDAIISVLSPRKQSSSLASRPRRGSSTQRRLKVLLAEDNAVNQMLATRILEKLDHHVTVVGNGREAVSKAQASRFDLIIMDVQMPEMDGLEATAAIREWEKTTGKHIPILAMTAHAMKGDRERCLAAGMDGYVSKPIRIADLEEAVTQATAAKESSNTVSTNPAEGGVMDEAAVLAGLDGNRGLLRDLARLFLADYPKQLVEIKAAIQGGDAERLRRAAHALKGSVGNFAAQRAFDTALQVEMLGKSGDVAAAQDVCVALEGELSQLSQELEKLGRNSRTRETKPRKRSRAK